MVQLGCHAVVAMVASLTAIGTATELSGQTGTRWSRLMAELAHTAKRDRAIQEMESCGDDAVRRLIAAVDLKRPDVARRLFYAIDELGHHGEKHLEALVGLRADCPSSLLPDLLATHLAVLLFMDTESSTTERLDLQELARIRWRSTQDKRLRSRFAEIFDRSMKLGPSDFLTNSALAADVPTDELVTELKKNVTWRKVFIARLLTRRGPQAKAAIPDLLKAIRLPSEYLKASLNRTYYPSEPRNKRRCAVAITKLAPNSEAAAEAYGYLALHGNALEQQQSNDALRRLAGKAESAVPSLTMALEGSWRGDDLIRPRTQTSTEKGEIMVTLGTIGSRAANSVPVLVKFAKGEDQRLAARARAALDSIRRTTPRNLKK